MSGKRARRIRQEVYQELKRTWRAADHHVVGTFTGARDRPSSRGGREWRQKVQADYQRRIG